MNIVIPMAGHSRRFAAAGYQLPKPFIPIDGKLMIERVCDMFSPDDHYFFVCSEEHLQVPGRRETLRALRPHAQVISIPPHENGPTFSALSVEEYLEPEDPVIVTYCDFTMSWNYERFLQTAAMHDGAIVAFKGFHPASLGDTYYCYLKVDKEMRLTDLQEKKPFTSVRTDEYASTGVYYFDTWRCFAEYSRKLQQKRTRRDGEFYTSLVYLPMLEDKLSIAVFEARKFICWGTPNDLAEYEFWSKYFQHVAREQALST